MALVPRVEPLVEKLPRSGKKALKDLNKYKEDVSSELKLTSGI